MACAVYCLIRHPDQLDPLVKRLRNAGVRNENIAVVVPQGSAALTANLTGATRLAQVFWDMSLCSVLALWWPLVVCGWVSCQRGDPAVMPLEDYKKACRQK